MRLIILSFSIALLCIGKALAQEPTLVIPTGHQSTLGLTVLSKSGKLLATTALKEKEINIWSVDNGLLLKTIIDSTAYFGFDRISFSPDEKTLITTNDEVTKAYDVQTGKYKKEIDQKANYRNQPNTEKLIAFTTGKELIVKESATAKILKKISLIDRKVVETNFSADQKYLIITYNIGVDVLNTDTWTSLPKLLGEKYSIGRVSGDKLFVISKTKMTIYDVSGHKLLMDRRFLKPISAAHLDRDQKLYYSLADTLFTLDGKDFSITKKTFDFLIKSIKKQQNYLCLSGSVNTLLFDVDRNEVYLDFKGQTELYFTKDGEALISMTYGSGADKERTLSKIQLWNLKSKKLIKSREEYEEYVIAIDEINHRFLTSNAKSIAVYDLTVGELISKWSWGGHVNNGFNFESDSSNTKIASSALWDVSKAERIALPNRAYLANTKFSKDGKFLLSYATTEDEEQCGWEIYDLELNREIFSKKLKGQVLTASLSDNGQKAIVVVGNTDKSEIYSYDLITGKEIKILSNNPNIISTNIFPDADYFVVSYGSSENINLPGFTEIRTFQNPAIAKRVVGKILYQEQSIFNYNGSVFLTKSKDFIHIIDAKKMALIKSLPVKGNSALFSPNGKEIITDALIIVDIEGRGQRKLVENIELKSLLTPGMDLFQVIEPLKFTPNGKYLYSRLQVTRGNTGVANQIFLWDAKTLNVIKKDENLQTFMNANGSILLNTDLFAPYGTKLVHRLLNKQIALPQQLYAIDDAIFSKESKFLYTGSKNEIAKWDVANGKLIAKMYAIDSTDYVIHLPSGYYKASQNGAKLLHYVTKDLNVITFAQLDIKYNRPDKVLQAMGSLDTALINSYKQAYDKRIKKLKIDTTGFTSGYAVPAADFNNRNTIKYQQTNEELTLKITAKDDKFNLDRFNVWVNEVPLYGMLGINLRGRVKPVLDTTITIKLSAGENRIETAVTNVNGTESYRMPLFINYHPADLKRPKMYFVGIGINRFIQKDYNLNYSVKDIRDLTNSLKKKYGEDFVVVDTLFDENVSKENVDRLKAKLLATDVNDKVIIAYSGHGLLDKNYDYFLSTYSVDFDNPTNNGLPYESLEALADGIPSRQKLLLIDACHSGEVDKDDLQMVAATEAERNKASVKGVKIKVINKSKKVGMKNSFELMQELFVNVNKSTGATIISAAGGTQYALEKGELKNGVFTYSILELLKDRPTIKVSELKTAVSERVEKLTAGAQKPTSRNENILVDWDVW